MKSDLQELINIGPSLEVLLLEIGIKSKKDFLSQDLFKIFEKILKKNPTFPKPVLASLVGAKENTPWFLIMNGVVDEYEKSHPDHKWTKYRK